MILKNIGLSGLILFLFFSCNSKRAHLNQTTNVFRYNEAALVSSLDPAFATNSANAWIINQLFNGLVQLDENLEVKPCIAKSWYISSDGLEYTFTLRNDVYFQDHVLFLNNKGRKVRAADFVNSFNRLLNAEIGSPGAWIFNDIDKSSKSNYSGFVDVNDTTLKIYLTHPHAAFIRMLTMQFCTVIPIEISNYYGINFRTHPIGTGPFKLKHWKEGESLILVKNPTYFEKEGTHQLPYLDGVSISFEAKKQTAFFEFMKGNLDFLSGIDASYKDDILNKDGTLTANCKGKIKMIKAPYLLKHYLGFSLSGNTKITPNSPLKNKLVRKAIAVAINKRKLVVYLENNLGTPANWGIMPVGLPCFDSSKVSDNQYNPEKAKLLLSRAGYSFKNPFPPITLYATEASLSICDFIKDELKNSGIQTAIRVAPTSTFSEMIVHDDLEFYLNTWQAKYPDAENCFGLLCKKTENVSGKNTAKIWNTNYNLLYERACVEMDMQRRCKIYQEMDQIIANDVPIIPLYDEVSMFFTQNSISGLVGNSMNLLSLKKVKKN